jgi:hypothetical protein
MKTFKQLKEDTVGVVENIMNPAEIRNLRQLTEKVSASYQADVVGALKKLEDELNKFGYSLGQIEVEGDLGDEGEAFLVAETFSTHELVKNVYFIMKWEKLSNGQQYQYRSEGSALNFRVDIKTFEASPALLRQLIDTYSEGYIYYDIKP